MLFEYRLAQAPQLSLCLFINTEKNGLLLLSLKGQYQSIPDNWESLPSRPIFQDGQLIWNDLNCPVIAIHSVVVRNEYQARELGRDLVKAYILYLKSMRVTAKHVVLIAHHHLIPFYESCWFENRGLGECRFACGVWYAL
ncbi:hypothetical protein N7495_004553, partial [Penicillium taxi]|uniref:uncharacterized protein n=1 Tax=Penicillium taxi TaxID=168475 RepID=UPI002545011E